MKNGLTKKILWTLFIAGCFTIAATSPYFLTNIARAYFRGKKYNKRKVAKTLYSLKKSRLIIGMERNGVFEVRLTKEGRKMIKKYQFDELKVEKQKVWDKKWRILIFDIPEESRKIAREALREKLKRLSFYQLQERVWVCPYPCEKEIKFLAEVFEINPYINIILADRIFDDMKVREYFELPKS